MKLPKILKLLLAPLIALLLVSLIDLVPGKPYVTYTAAITVWMAIWWLTEVVNLAVTALLPLVLFPLMGIMNGKVVAEQYIDQIIFLFIGGFMLSFAIKRWNLHERIALRILMIVGSKPANILFGVMLTSYFISMWISNTATVLMLLSAVLAIVHKMESHIKEKHHISKVATALLIGLAYAATIGGMATLVGTPTNMIFLRAYQDNFPSGTEMNFIEWFKIGFPVSLVFLALAYFILFFVFIRKFNVELVEKNYFANAYYKLGKMTFEEKIVSGVFVGTALLWFTRSDIYFGANFQMKGWSNLFSNKDYISDSTVAIFSAIVLFLIPSKTEKGKALLEWEDVKDLPVDVILLFGGGFALAKGFEVSGLSDFIAGNLMFMKGYDLQLFILLMCVLVALISEFASNVACIQLMIPILIAIQPDMGINPLMLLIPATLASSLGFMLPVATAPNTIVFATKRIRVNDFLLAGLYIDLVGITIVTMASYFLM